jgi:endoglycosylceramidase
VKWAKLDVLSQPYPQLVAGTPRGWRFDPATRVFQLTYSTKSPGGKAFARRLRKRSKRALKARQTEIFLGRARYPTGYRISARGGAIMSKPNAGVLKWIACPGRRSVTVTVGPPGSSVHRHVGCRVRPRG